jgi:hypothetical protein
MAKRLALIALAALGLCPAPLSAQTIRVHLTEPGCRELPFAPTRLRELLAIELAVDGVVIVDDPEVAQAVIAYEPEPCEPGATRFVMRLTPQGGELRLHRADMSAIPLATVPRALALELAEALRGDPVGDEGPPIEEAPELPEPPPPPRVEVPLEPAPDTGPPLRVGGAASVRNTPDTGGTLAGARLFIDLPIGDHLPFIARIDAGAAFGPSAHDLVLGSISGGITFSVWARAVPELALRFGPRLWVAHGWAFDATASNAARGSAEVQVGAGLVVAGEVALGGGVELLLEGEVGTHMLGLDYVVPGGRSGFVGAYWGLDLALAWEIG